MVEFAREPRTYYEVWIFNANWGRWKLLGRRMGIEAARELASEKSSNHDIRICEVIEKTINTVDFE